MCEHFDYFLVVPTIVIFMGKSEAIPLGGASVFLLHVLVICEECSPYHEHLNQFCGYFFIIPKTAENRDFVITHPEISYDFKNA